MSQTQARALAVLGSASDVGKSLVSAALCRLLSDQGLNVAPFKAQNMANQAGVTDAGLEMPRAQILQAIACRQPPHVDMGPVLMKPVSPTGAQIVVLGKAQGCMEARAYFADTSRLAAVALQAMQRLLSRHEVVVLEGAGSPVELNLWPRDYVNLLPAQEANAAMVLVVDIDRGGVFAQAKGTIDLLPAACRERLLGIVVNRFRGDLSLFSDGPAHLERVTGTPVLGVIPYIDHGLDEEDRPLRIPIDAKPEPGKLHVGAILYPRVANTEDLAPLLCEPDVQLTWLSDSRLVREQDVLVLPGSKATVGDLVYLTASAMSTALQEANARGAWLLGLCGGYQMLGEELRDDAASEGGPAFWPGLSLLPVQTMFRTDKVTRVSTATSAWPRLGHALHGYEIHHGTTALVGGDDLPSAKLGEPLCVDFGAALGWRRERVVGTYLHGLLASNSWRNDFLNRVRDACGFAPRGICSSEPMEARLDRWAAHVRTHLVPGAWERILAAVSPH